MDYTRQMNFSNLVKTGIELVYNDLNFDFGTIARCRGTGKRTMSTSC